MRFEWHEAKRASNLRRHRIDFVRAARIFENLILERTDSREDYGEDRTIALGHHEWFFMVVVYTRRGEARRIISARRASTDEREEYYARILGGSAEDAGPYEN